MRARFSQASATPGRKPLPSAPTTSAAGRLSLERVRKREIGFAFKRDGKVAHARSVSMVRARFVTRDMRHEFDRARCRFCQHASQRRRLAVLQDDGTRAERRGGAERRADVLRIGDAVENEHAARRPAARMPLRARAVRAGTRAPPSLGAPRPAAACRRSRPGSGCGRQHRRAVAARRCASRPRARSGAPDWPAPPSSRARPKSTTARRSLLRTAGAAACRWNTVLLWGPLRWPGHLVRLAVAR